MKTANDLTQSISSLNAKEFAAVDQPGQAKSIFLISLSKDHQFQTERDPLINNESKNPLLEIREIKLQILQTLYNACKKWR